MMTLRLALFLSGVAFSAVAASLDVDVTVTHGGSAAVTLSQVLTEVPDTVPAGTVIATAKVQSPSGALCPNCKLLSSDAVFAIAGMNVVTARALTPSDDGTTHQAVISVPPQIFPILSPDGSKIAAPGVTLTARDGGVWSFDGAKTGPVADSWLVLLNGQPAQGFFAKQILVNNGGKIYVAGIGHWWLWDGSSFQDTGTASTAPPPTTLLAVANPSAIAVDPSATLTVKIVAPPAGPPVPLGALAAGYTTLAHDSDFTKPMPPNWLGGCPNPGDGSGITHPYWDDGVPHQWWMNIWWSATYQPCNSGQVQDPKYGGLVLDMPWKVQNAYATVGTVIQSASWDGNQVHDYPHGSYYEAVSRLTPTDQRGVYMVFHTWGPGGIKNQDCACQAEWDVMETDSDQLQFYDSAVHNWGNGGGASWILYPWTNLTPGTNYDPTNYNTYGLRVTYDGSNMVGCTYINNVTQKCATLPGGVSAAEQAGRNFLVYYTACDQWNMPNGVCQEGLQQHLYTKSIRVWSCANWQTTQCGGSLLAAP